MLSYICPLIPLDFRRSHDLLLTALDSLLGFDEKIHSQTKLKLLNFIDFSRVSANVIERASHNTHTHPTRMSCGRPAGNK